MQGVGLTDRPGIVHRLDKDTTGILLLARNNPTHAVLCGMFKDRAMHKTYLALVHGHPPKEGAIELAIARDPHNRKKMTHVDLTDLKRVALISTTKREALTHYRVLEYFENSALVEVKPVTGRTHQIRVHFAALGHPLIGDYVYGIKSKEIGRQALHAHRLLFEYEGKEYQFESPLPHDITTLIEKFRKNNPALSS